MFQDGSAHASTDILGRYSRLHPKRITLSLSQGFLLSVYINLHKVYEFIQVHKFPCKSNSKGKLLSEMPMNRFLLCSSRDPPIKPKLFQEHLTSYTHVLNTEARIFLPLFEFFKQDYCATSVYYMSIIYFDTDWNQNRKKLMYQSN